MRPSRWLDRIDGLGAVRFTALLYALRWLVLLPVLWGIRRDGVDPDSTARISSLAARDVLDLAYAVLVAAPAYESALECSLPYVVLHFLLRGRVELDWRRPWLFIACSALVMVLVHPLEWRVVLPTAITGLFLGYTYGHFAPHGHVRAWTATAAFHAAINLVGLALLALAKGAD